MNSRTDKILAGLVVALAIALVAVVAGTLNERIVNAGDTAPDFQVVTDDGKTFTNANFGGKVLVLNFWASWCAPCVKEAPSLNAFAKQYGPQGVVVLAVSIDRNEKLYREFIRRYGVTFETARDPEGNVSASYGTFQIPETYIIDRSGKVVEKIISDQDWMDPMFTKHVQSML